MYRHLKWKPAPTTVLQVQSGVGIHAVSTQVTDQAVVHLAGWILVRDRGITFRSPSSFLALEKCLIIVRINGRSVRAEH